MGSPPHMALLPRVGPIQVATKGTCTQRSMSPPATGQITTGQEDITDQSSVNKVLHRILQVSQSLVTGHPATGIGLKKYSPKGKSIFTSHWSTGHRPPVVRLYTNLYLVIIMPWAWSSLLIDQTWVLNIYTDMKFRTQLITQKEFFYTWNQTLVVCLIPVLSSSRLTTTGNQTTDKSQRLPSLDIFPEGTSLDKT